MIGLTYLNQKSDQASVASYNLKIYHSLHNIIHIWVKRLKNLHRVPKVYWEILGAFSDSTTILILWCIDFYGGISKVQSLWRNKLFCRREVPFAIFFIPDSCYHYQKGKNILSSEAEIVQQQPWLFHPCMVGGWIRVSVLMCSGCHWRCSMKAERYIIEKLENFPSVSKWNILDNDEAFFLPH